MAEMHIKLIFIWVAIFIANLGYGQTNNGSRVLISAPREYQRQLALAQKAIDAGEYADAIEMLNLVLLGREDAEAKELGEDFFIGETPDGHFGDSIHAKAERLLLTMPAKALEVYELQFGAEANRMLKEAILKRDIMLLSELRRRFFATEAGLAATVLIGRHFLDSGQPLAAARCFSNQNIVRANNSALKQEMLLMRGASYYFAGDKTRAQQAIDQLQKEFPAATFQIGGKSHSIASMIIGQSDNWIENLFGVSGFAKSKNPVDWLVVGGDAQRNAESNGSFPLLKLRWRLPVTDDPALAEAIQQAERNRREGRNTLIPSLQPVVVGGNVYLRGPRQMVAVSLATGKRVWAFPWAEIQREDEYGNDSSSANTKAGRVATMQSFVWEDSVFTQLSSDGEAIYLVDQLQSLNFSASPDFNGVFWDRGITNGYNVLVALEMSSEGKYLWRVGNADGEDEPELAGAYFLGAPLVVGEDLYVIAERNGDVTLFVLHRKTGKIQWSQQLAHFERTFVSPRYLKKAGAVPSFSDGILVCPTASGAIVAVDIASRSLLWGNQYLTSPRIFNARRNQLAQFGQFDDDEQRWLDSSVIISNGSVVATPPDSKELLHLDLLTGNSKWKRTVPRQDDLYIASVHQGIISLVANRYMRGIELESGREVWRVKIPSDNPQNISEATGRGFRTGDRYFLPTTNAILMIDIVKGKLLEEVRCNEPLHNLVAHQDQIISLGPEWLTAFFQIEKLTDIVKERLNQNPQDLWAMEQQGLLLVNAGDVEKGRSLIRTAFDNYSDDNPDRDGARQNLVDVTLDMLNADFKKHQTLAPELEELIDRRTDRNRFWLALGRGYLETDQPHLAFEAYIRLAFSNRSMRIGLDPTQLEQVNSVHSVLPERSIQSGIHQALLRANETQRETMSRRLSQVVDETLRNDEISEMTKCIRNLGTLPEVDPVRLKVAQHFFGIENLLKAEQVLLNALESTDPKIAASSHILLGRIYAKAGYPSAAAKCFIAAGNGWPNEQIADGKTVAAMIASLSRPQSIRSHISQANWNYGAVTIEEQANSITQDNTARFFRSANYRHMQMDDQLRSLEPKLSVFLDQSAIVATDDYGVEHFRTSSLIQTYGSQSLSVAAKKVGGLLVLNYGDMLSVFNTLDKHRLDSQIQAPLWPSAQSMIMRRPNERQSNKTRVTKWGQEIVSLTGGKISSLGPMTSEGFVYIEGGRLTCVDPLTGSTNWVRSDIKSGASVWGDDQFVFVVDAGAFEARVFDFVDGRDLGKKPLPTSEKIWKNVGRYVLAVRDERMNDEAVWAVAMFDPWTGSDLWVRHFARQFRGYADDRGYVAIVEPSGEVNILDLHSGKSLVASQVESLDSKSRVTLDVSKDQFMLTCLKNQVKTQAEIHLDGLVYAFNRKTGAQQWQRPLEIGGQAKYVGLPQELPLLVYYRMANPQARRQRSMELTCVDKRDGRILLQRELQIKRPGLNIQGDLATNQLSLKLPDNKVYSMTFTDEPTSPAPVARIHPPEVKNLLNPLIEGFEGR